MVEVLNIKDAITGLKTLMSEAGKTFNDWIITSEDWHEPDWIIEICYLRLLAIIESIGLLELRKMVFAEYNEKKNSKDAFKVVGTDASGEPYSIDLSRLRQLFRTVEQFFQTKESTTITKDIMQILRDIHYTITDKTLFVKVPQNEADVHIRIEGILKCVFPDLKHKPTLTKPIKNFEPDTGISSINTLIEYKYLCRKEDITAIADQVLADTRGYISKDWNHFIYVIYETNRFRPEKDWIQLLRQSGVPENTKLIVLSGEPPQKRKKKTLIKPVEK